MTIGQFDKRLQIKEKLRTPNGRGGATIQEQEVDQVWCRIRQAKPQETRRHSTKELEITTIIEIRWHPLIKPGRKYVAFIGEGEDKRRFEISTPIDKDFKGRFLELPALEVF